MHSGLFWPMPGEYLCYFARRLELCLKQLRHEKKIKGICNSKSPRFEVITGKYSKLEDGRCPARHLPINEALQSVPFRPPSLPPSNSPAHASIFNPLAESTRDFMDSETGGVLERENVKKKNA